MFQFLPDFPLDFVKISTSRFFSPFSLFSCYFPYCFLRSKSPQHGRISLISWYFLTIFGKIRPNLCNSKATGVWFLVSGVGQSGWYSVRVRGTQEIGKPARSKRPWPSNLHKFGLTLPKIARKYQEMSEIRSCWKTGKQ